MINEKKTASYEHKPVGVNIKGWAPGRLNYLRGRIVDYRPRVTVEYLVECDDGERIWTQEAGT